MSVIDKERARSVLSKLEKEIDEAAHNDLLTKLASQM